MITSTAAFADIDPEQWNSFIDAKGYQYVKYDDARQWLAGYLGTSMYYVKNNYSIAYIESSQVLIMGTCQPDLDGVEYIYQFYYGKDLKLNVKKAGSDGSVHIYISACYDCAVCANITIHTEITCCCCDCALSFRSRKQGVGE